MKPKSSVSKATLLASLGAFRRENRGLKREAEALRARIEELERKRANPRASPPDVAARSAAKLSAIARGVTPSPLSLDRAVQAWGESLPAWVRGLAEWCDRESQARVAKVLDFSPAVINQVIGNRYKGRVDRVKTAVEQVSERLAVF